METHTHTHTYIYIYIERERERDFCLSSQQVLRKPVSEKENFEFKLLKFHLRIDLMSHPDHGEGVE